MGAYTITHKVDGTLRGKAAELAVTILPDYCRRHPCRGGIDIECRIGITDDSATGLEPVDADTGILAPTEFGTVIEDLEDPSELVQWAEYKGFAWNDEVNTDSTRFSALLGIIADELGWNG